MIVGMISFGMIVVDLRHVGTTAWLSEVLKISVRTSVSCAAQSFSTRPGMLCIYECHEL